MYVCMSYSLSADLASDWKSAETLAFVAMRSRVD